MASGDTKTNQYLDIAANGTRADLPTDTCCETRTQSLIRGVAERVIGVEEEVERLENNPDVVDIVATYQDLQNYDTSGLTDKDIIRVLQDETHDGNSTYYRWNTTTSQFDFVGEITDGSSIKELSSADYNYPTSNPDRVALWLLDNGVYTAPAGVMVAASTTSYPWYNTSDKTILVGGNDTVKGLYTFLNGKTDVVTTQVSDGTEADEYTLFKSTQVLQTTGQSTTDTMSQKAITDALAEVGGGIKILTADDYNWNSTTVTAVEPFNSVALWLLEPGLYKIPQTGVSVLYGLINAWGVGFGQFVIIEKNNTGTKPITMYFFGSTDGIYFAEVSTSGSLERGLSYTLLSDRVEQSTGTSTNRVMSQNAVTSMVYASGYDPSTGSSDGTRVAIGGNSTAGARTTIAIGAGRGVTTALAIDSVALGESASVGNLNYRGSVALGSYAVCTAPGQVQIGSSQTVDGYLGNSNYRLLSGLYDPQSDHDAANKQYVDNLIAALEARIAALEGN